MKVPRAFTPLTYVAGNMVRQWYMSFLAYTDEVRSYVKRVILLIN